MPARTPPRLATPRIGDSAAGTPGAAGAGLLAGVVDPWTFAHAAGASPIDRAIEDIGPYEMIDGRPQSPNARYWTDLVGLPWRRDVDVTVRDVPVDLDGDHSADTRVTRRIAARGGILANPEVFGLVRTPEDPAGRIGRITASTGILGLREELDAAGKTTGRIGMTCWLCHGGRNPVDGTLIYGVAGRTFDYGALLATATVLDPANEDAATYRRTHDFPDGVTVRARLLLAGPGRQDLTGEFGLDRTVPGYQSAHYRGSDRMRQGTRGLFNPISVPSVISWRQTRLQNWSGSESEDDPWLERLAALSDLAPAAARTAFALPAGDDTAARRAVLLDLRNMGTLGLQQDSFPGLLWADAMRERVKIAPGDFRRVPGLYAAPAVRALITRPEAIARPTRNADRIARGRELFEKRIVGVLRNQQLIKKVPGAYAAAHLEPPVLAPIDPEQPLDAQLEVTCATCHDAAGGYAGFLLPFDANADGRAQADEIADARAGGIGTEALLAFDVPRGQWPFTVELPVIHGHAAATGPGTRAPKGARAAGRDPAPGKISRQRLGVAWVRTPPLQAVFATAPYLHNGSVPTLRALLEPAARRPKTFALGAGGGRFVYDTRLAGNRNLGHEYGVSLTTREKDDLVAFIESL